MKGQQGIFEGLEVVNYRLAVQGFKDIDARLDGEPLELKPGDEVEIVCRGRVDDVGFKERYDAKSDTFIGPVTRRMGLKIKPRSVEITNIRSREDIEAEWQQRQVKAVR